MIIMKAKQGVGKVTASCSSPESDTYAFTPSKVTQAWPIMLSVYGKPLDGYFYKQWKPRWKAA